MWTSSRFVSTTLVTFCSPSSSYGWVSAIWLSEEIISPDGSSAYAWVLSVSITVVVSIVTVLLSSSIIFFVCDDETISSWSSLFNCVDSITTGIVVGNVVPPITKLLSSLTSSDNDDDGINDEVKPFCFGVTSSESKKWKMIK